MPRRLRIAVVEDQPVERDLIIAYLVEWAKRRSFELTTVPFCSSEDFLFEWMDDQAFQLVILDIQMAEMDGFELAQRLRRDDPGLQILFVTGVDDYLAAGYEVGAINYLLKPLQEEKFWQTLDRCFLGQKAVRREILLTEQGEHYRIRQEDVLYIESEGHYLHVVTPARTYRIRARWHSLEALLAPELFVRTHRSYIVGIRYIRRVGRTEIMLDNEATIPVSRRQYDHVNQKFIGFFREGNL